MFRAVQQYLPAGLSPNPSPNPSPIMKPQQKTATAPTPVLLPPAASAAKASNHKFRLFWTNKFTSLRPSEADYTTKEKEKASKEETEERFVRNGNGYYIKFS